MKIFIAGMCLVAIALITLFSVYYVYEKHSPVQNQEINQNNENVLGNTPTSSTRKDWGGQTRKFNGEFVPYCTPEPYQFFRIYNNGTSKNMVGIKSFCSI